jgi:hypothetical protein
MTLSVLDVSQDVIDRVSGIIHSDNFLGELGGALIVLGVVLAIANQVKAWIKRKGYRMVLEDRNHKIHALLLDILCDGLEEAEGSGKISKQEKNRTYEMLRKRLGLRDLVPKKRIASEVKSKLKSDRYLREKARKEGKEHRPVIPGGPPTPIVKNRFVQTMGRAASFWRKAS